MKSKNMYNFDDRILFKINAGDNKEKQHETMNLNEHHESLHIYIYKP